LNNDDRHRRHGHGHARREQPERDEFDVRIRSVIGWIAPLTR
jgi:hypothetical protein